MSENETIENETTVTALDGVRALQTFDGALAAYFDGLNTTHEARGPRGEALHRELLLAWNNVVGLGTDEHVRDASIWWAAALLDARADEVVLLEGGEVVALESELALGNVTRIVRVSPDGCVLESLAAPCAYSAAMSNMLVAGWRESQAS